MSSDVIRIAESQVGFREDPKGSNRGVDIDKYTGARAEPWCAHFVAWVFREAGKPIPGDIIPNKKRANPLASVSHTERVFAEHGWLVREPGPGDVVFFKTRGQSDRGPGRHIGIVVGVDLTHIDVVDGNWGDRVSKRRIRRNDPEIVNYGRRP
jgi:hypothetical protein